MSLDPAAPAPANLDQRVQRRLAEHDRRLGKQERGDLVPVGNGVPTADPTKLPEGTHYLDRTNRRDYYVLGDGANPATNVWRYVALT